MATKISIPNLAKVRSALKIAKERLDDLEPVGRKATLYLLSLVQKNFKSDSPKSREWEPLSPVTLFVRRHRASAPTKSTAPLNDRGLLRNANFPFMRQGGAEFGVVNSLKYASVNQFGGTSPGGDVLIKNFPRRTKTGLSKVIKKFYTLHFKPGKVPARPFFPEQDEYMPGIRRIMLAHAKGALGG